MGLARETVQKYKYSLCDKRSDESLSNDDKGLKECSETIEVTSGDKNLQLTSFDVKGLKEGSETIEDTSEDKSLSLETVTLEIDITRM